jgi:endonuclease/exonuclease/phosphatase family metal-dependent hydrolase
MPPQLGYTWVNRNPLASLGFRLHNDDRIDYIFARGTHIKVQKCETVMDGPPFVSDHLGVMAFFELT